MLFPITNTIFYTMDHPESELNECAYIYIYIYFFFAFNITSYINT